jgi:cell division protein FtsW
MARFRKRAGEPGQGAVVEQQLGLFERLGSLTRRVEAPCPTQPAVKLFCLVVAIMGLGLLLQASHASTALADPADFRREVTQQSVFRVAALAVMLVAYRIGPGGLRRFLPALVVLSGLLLVACWLPGLASPRNGSNRWVVVPLTGLTVQPSELARVFLGLWVADRCTRLGPLLSDLRRGMLPILGVGLTVFILIGMETDLGGALVFLTVFLATWFVGGASIAHFTGSALTLGSAAILAAVTSLDYVRSRLETFLDQKQNDQVDASLEALGSGDLYGVGLGQGGWRTSGMPYQDSDYIFSLLGEELGFLGLALVVGMMFAFLWFALRLVLSIRDRFAALSAFGLLMGVAVQAMIHMQVVTGLAPPKGMSFPFLSDGGTSLLVSALAVGLALGAARGPGGEARSA